MATISGNPSAPLSQALARKKRNPLPLLLTVIGLIGALGFAALGYLESRRTETVVVFIRDVAYGSQISADDLGTLELPLHRPIQLQGIADPQAVIGRYAGRNLGINDLAQPSMLMNTPPSQPVYPNGEMLNTNMVPVPFSTETIGPLTFRDRVNIGFNDPTGDPALCDEALSAVAGEQPTSITPPNTQQHRPYACRLLSYMRVLYVEDGIAYLEMTPYQSQTIWALQAAGLQLWGERYGVTSDDLGVLQRIDIGQVNSSDLIAPVPAAQPSDEAETTPGASSAIPGSNTAQSDR